MMRGYARLKAQGRMGVVALIREELTVTPIADAGTLASPLLRLGGDVIERTLRQLLIIRHLQTPLPEALYRSAGRGLPVVFPMPRAWREVVARNGFKVAGHRCALLWAGAVCAHWANGVRVLFRQVGACLRAHHQLPVPPARYAYFDGLVEANLPQGGPDPGRDGVIGWYFRWSDRAHDLSAAVHSAAAAPRQFASWRVQSAASPLPLLARARAWRFLAHGLREAAASLVELTRGRWQRAFGLAETVRALQASLAQPEALARDYLFHNSNWVFRPLWTHVAESHGSRILFYFYSTNCEKLCMPGLPSTVPFGWKAGNWPTILAWDEGQRHFVLSGTGHSASVLIVGPVDFLSARTADFSLPSDNGIAVFDVQPQRDTLYRRLGLDFEYYIPPVAKAFIRELTQAVDGTGCTLVLKRKRDIGRHLHPAYSREIERSVKEPTWMEVPPQTLALDVIRACKAVVSMPYTSTALVARHHGKPSVYYDASRLIARDDPAAHGIPILQTPEELNEWILTVVAPQKEEILS
jgi:polysaccharide biosynthesis PFTS motif protein